MYRSCKVLIGAALIASTHALAGQVQPDDKSVIGKVEGMYVSEQAGLYMDARLTPCGRQLSSPTIVGNRIVYLEMRSVSQERRCEPLFALVRLLSKEDGVSANELVKVPADIVLSIGDDVELAMGEDKSYKATGPIHMERRIVRRLQTEEQFAQQLPHGSKRNAH